MGDPANINMESIQSTMEQIGREGQEEASDFYDFLTIQLMEAKAAHEEENMEELMVRMKIIGETGGAFSDFVMNALMNGADIPEADGITAPILVSVPFPNDGFKGFDQPI